MICWYALLLISHYGLLKIWPWNFQEIIWALLQFIVMLKFSSKPHRAVTVGLLNDTRWWFGGQTSSPKSVCMYFGQSLSFTPPPSGSGCLCRIMDFLIDFLLLHIQRKSQGNWGVNQLNQDLPAFCEDVWSAVKQLVDWSSMLVRLLLLHLMVR